MGILRRHWMLVVGAVPVGLQVFHWVDRGLEYAEHVDYVRHHLNDIKTWWAMISDIPEWTNELILAGGLVFIVWDIRRARRRAAVVAAAPSMPTVINRPPEVERRGPDGSRLTELTPGERERLGNVIYGLSEIIHKRAEPLIIQSNQISAARQKLPLVELRKRLETLQDNTREMFDELFNKFPSTNEFYRYEIFQIIDNDLTPNVLRNSINDYMVMIDHLNGVDEAKSLNVLEFGNKSLVIATHNLQQWIIRALQRISVIRASLRGSKVI
jgi:hypothetical protein